MGMPARLARCRRLRSRKKIRPATSRVANGTPRPAPRPIARRLEEEEEDTEGLAD